MNVQEWVRVYGGNEGGGMYWAIVVGSSSACIGPCPLSKRYGDVTSALMIDTHL